MVSIIVLEKEGRTFLFVYSGEIYLFLINFTSTTQQAPIEYISEKNVTMTTLSLIRHTICKTDEAILSVLQTGKKSK